MLGMFVKFMILLVALRTLKNTFPAYVSLMIMKSYLLMQRVFIVNMISNKLKNLLLLRMLMKLLLWLKSMMLLFTNLIFLPYLNIVMIIMLPMPMLNHILRTPPLSNKRLIFCRSLWKKKLMKLWAHWLLQNIGLFLDSGDFLNKCINIGIVFIILITIFKYVKKFRFVESNIILFKPISNFISTLKSNKFFNLFDIIVTVTPFTYEDKISLSLNSHW